MAKVLHASYSGYFPDCIQTAPESKSNLVGGTLEQIMELYWRVRAWRLDSVSGSIDIDGEILNYFASAQTLGSVSATTEADLVCNLSFSGNASYTLSGSFGSQTSQLDTTLGGGSFYFDQNTSYYMAFGFDMLFVTTQETAYVPLVSSGGQVGSITINGLSVPLYGYVDGPARPITGNLTASISPIAYWTYGP